MNGLFFGVNGKYDRKKETLYRKQSGPLQARFIIGYLDEEITKTRPLDFQSDGVLNYRTFRLILT